MKNITGALLYMVPPFLSKYVLETVLPRQDWNLLILVSICMVAAPIMGSIMIVWENVWGRFMLQLSGRGQADLFNGIQHRPLRWLRQNRMGDLLTRILDDTRFITDMMNGHIGFMMFHVVTILVGSTILLVLQPLLASVVLAVWAGQAMLMSSLGRQVKQKAAETARHNSIISETVRELISGAAFLKSSGQDAKALSNVKECLHREWEHTRRSLLADHQARLIHAALNAGSLVLMYTAGGWFVLNGSMTVGSLVAFVAVYNWLRPFGISMIDMAITAVKIGPAVDRIADIAFPAAQPHKGIVPDGPLALEAKGITFRHESRTILDDIHFRIPPGAIVSIVGYRGSGKSTLADVLLGLQEPAAGSILLNDIPLAAVDSVWLRRSVLCVTQDVMLRSGTILDNILYGTENASLEAIREAVQIAELEQWISRLPDGLHTRVGEQALQISGGERQRISIARALLRKPAVLILDEATSALDQGTERRLLTRLIAARKGTTMLFITHRLDIALRSDEIFLLDEGRLADRGTHEELLQRTGTYQELWKQQMERCL
ncbi:ABC transporter ATP-binding protein [Paenibacillus cymbidii]|uniref:ABC transporter ATP-binding protein n=1 Tax=Paenibacillus cymbidii TaxID=1639034 RepID=UPI0022A81837|nr:ABC transporter ATP-binding protein [Paenibacillus cymbidii]